MRKRLLYENVYYTKTFAIWRRLLYGNVYYMETFANYMETLLWNDSKFRFASVLEE